MGDQGVKITNIKFINELTRDITLVKKEGEVEDWILPYAKIDRGLWSVYSYSCAADGDVFNGDQE